MVAVSGTVAALLAAAPSAGASGPPGPHGQSRTAGSTTVAARAGLWHPAAAARSALTAGVGRPALPPATASAGGWRDVATPNPTIVTGYLDGLACPSANRCVAVGYSNNSVGDVVPLAERRTGAGWQAVRAARPAGSGEATLNAVACAAPKDCTAVGYYFDAAGGIHPLAERWTGGNWVIEHTPEPAGAQGTGLFGVSCPAVGSCLAVGTYNSSSGTPDTLAESWNGTAWTQVATPNPTGATASQLAAISCPTAGTCSATGSYRQSSGTELTLAETWDGHAWTIAPTADPSGAMVANLLGVSCTASGSCLAAGYYADDSGNTFAFAESRASASAPWAMTPAVPVGTAANPQFSGVACASATACTAVGSASIGPLIERWDGAGWTEQPARSNPIDGMAAVACATTVACTGVGYDLTVQDYPRPLADSWRAGTWRVQPSAALHGATTSNLLAVSCTGAATCIAAGFNTRPDDTSVTLVELRSGASWSRLPSPSPAGSPNSVLDGISCRSAASCVAVGYSFTSAGIDAPLAEVWDGQHWTVRPVPIPSAAVQGADLDGVSCSSASACAAVGQYVDSAGNQDAFAERWNGSTWQVESVPVPRGATGGTLSAVSCPTGSSCTAVGDYDTKAGEQASLIETWSGHAWTVRSVASPSGASASQLVAVVCPSSTSCTAVGNYLGNRGVIFSLAVVGSGATWARQKTPNPAGMIASQLTGVACSSPTVCSAVGYTYSLGSSGLPNPPFAFAEQRAGQQWSDQTVPIPSGSNSTLLSAVSCSGGSCTGVGYRFASSGRQVTFGATRTGG